MVSDLIRDARFVLVFVGECPFVGVFDGWDALLAEIHTQYTVDDEEHAELIERLEDADAWSIDTCRERHLPFTYCEDTGEIGSMSIYRITEDAKPRIILVDGKTHEAFGTFVGSQLRQRVGVPDDRDLFLANPAGDDWHVRENQAISVGGGERFYTAPKEING